MQIIPIKTRVLQPPQDDLFAVLDEYVRVVRNGDVIAISSKVVAIHQGRCVEKQDANIDELIKGDASLVIERPYWNSPLTVTQNAFISAAGIDESNANGYLIRLPLDVFGAAKQIQEYLKREHGLAELGAIVVDSHSTPFRYGASGVALGWWGIEPLLSHIGKKDLFGREIKYERSNIADGIASAATVVMGEVAESQPIALIRGVPNLTYTEEDTRDMLFADFQDDTFRVLYERFLT